MPALQIFGLNKSQASRAAQRFFKERRAAFQFVDLDRKPMSPGEIRRFIQKFGLQSLLDTEGKAYTDAGLKYLKVSDTDLLERIERQPSLLKLPLVRYGDRVAIGHDEPSWKSMLETAAQK
jgi:arsenate reductase-like glutaredoxin family protein